MSNARNLADIVTGNFDVPLGALDNVPASNDASALTTGTLPLARIGTGTAAGLSIGGNAATATSATTAGNGGVTSVNGAAGAVTFSAGKVLQVVSVSKVDAFSTTTTNSWVDITGMAASITPTSASSKILVMVQLTIGGGGNNYGRGYGVKRGATHLNLGTYGTGNPGSFSASTNHAGGGDGGVNTAPFTYLDSPATTSSITYQVELFADSRSVTGTKINRTQDGTNVGSYGSSTITLMEIAG